MQNGKTEVLERINLSKLNYTFINPPILVSGMALMYYDLRESTKDIDLIISREDHNNLAKLLAPKAVLLEDTSKSGYKETSEFVDLYEDHGILMYDFEIWDSIYQVDYEYLKSDATQEEDFLVISLEKLLILSFIRGLKNPRYMEDAKLIGKKIENNLYENVVPNKNEYWRKILRS